MCKLLQNRVGNSPHARSLAFAKFDDKGRIIRRFRAICGIEIKIRVPNVGVALVHDRRIDPF
ncbi:hypothetical protein AL036_22120 [Salipiger aestuarii]|nr:hypothetical protein AL036_22120 [Salipiger aestuarii]KAA8605828.1 hypothetical protein AL037_21070 [Salipiger aestuarii]